MFRNAISLLIIHLFEGILESCTEFKMNKWNCTRFKINMKITHKKQTTSTFWYYISKCKDISFRDDSRCRKWSLCNHQFFSCFFFLGKLDLGPWLTVVHPKQEVGSVKEIAQHFVSPSAADFMEWFLHKSYRLTTSNYKKNGNSLVTSRLVSITNAYEH